MTTENRTPAELLVLDCAELYLSEEPRACEILNVPAHYKDKDGYRRSIETMELDGRNAVTLAMAFAITDECRFRDKCIEILNAWGGLNRGAGTGGDSALTFATRGQNLIEAGIILSQCNARANAIVCAPPAFLAWVNNVYVPTLERLSRSWVHRWNNHCSWALAGLIMARYMAYLNSGSLSPDSGELRAKLVVLWGRAVDHFKFCSKRLPILSKPGELWIENLRTNSGIYYTYFNLAAFVKADLYLTQFYGCFDGMTPLEWRGCRVRTALSTLFNFCVQPDGWQYKPTKIPGLKQVQQAIFPCSDTVRVPESHEKGGQLFGVSGALYNNTEWGAWATCPINTGDAFWHSSFFRDAILRSNQSGELLWCECDGRGGN